MGYKRHHTVAVASFRECSLRRAHQEAAALCGTGVSSIVVSSSSSGWFVFIAPNTQDGCWSHSDNCNKAQQDFKIWLRAAEAGRCPPFLDWVEVDYDDESGFFRVLDHSNIANLTLDGLAVLASALHRSIGQLLSDLYANDGKTKLGSVAEKGRQQEVILS
jgi:hypothetical protein